MCSSKNNEPDCAGTSDPVINMDLIPEYQKRLLVEFALELTRDVFSQPGEYERYQTWLETRHQRKKP